MTILKILLKDHGTLFEQKRLFFVEFRLEDRPFNRNLNIK